MPPETHRLSTHLADLDLRVRLVHTLAKSGGIELQDTPVACDELEVAADPGPHTAVLLKAAVRVVAVQTDQVKVAYQTRLESLDQSVLRVKVLLEKLLVGAADQLSDFFIARAVVVDWDGEDVVN